MKKVITLILILSLVLSFTACGNDDKKANDKGKDLEIKNEQVLEEDTAGEKDVETGKDQAVDDKESVSSKDNENKNPSTKPNANTGTSNNGSSNKPSNNSGSTNNSTNTGGNNTSSSSNSGNANNNSQTSGSNSGNTESETPKEKTVTITVPIYGEMYREYWIKDSSGKIIYTTKDSKEWERILSTPDSDIYFAASTYGSSGKQDIIGYKEYTMTESEYQNSWWYNNPDVQVKYN